MTGRAAPGASAAECISRAAGEENGPVVVASVCGTDLDPQPRARQAQRLRDAGVLVAPANALAAELALAVLATASAG